MGVAKAREKENHFLKRGMLSKGVVALKKIMKIGLPLTK